MGWSQLIIMLLELTIVLLISCQ